MKTVLIVDDDSYVQEILTEFLDKQMGYKTISAEDGETAIDLIHENEPDLILLDMLLPRIGGIALYKDLTKMDNAKNTPVIFMSGMMIDEVFKEEGIEMGAVDYIEKPIDFSYLQKKIEEVLM